MSSMVLKTVFKTAILAGTALATSSIASAQDGSSWDRARSNLVAGQQGAMAPAIERWEYLIGQDGLPFSTYANFITTYQGFPQQDRLQRRAEAALDRGVSGVEETIRGWSRMTPKDEAQKKRLATGCPEVLHGLAAQMAGNAATAKLRRRGHLGKTGQGRYPLRVHAKAGSGHGDVLSLQIEGAAAVLLLGTEEKLAANIGGARPEYGLPERQQFICQFRGDRHDVFHGLYDPFCWYKLR